MNYSHYLRTGNIPILVLVLSLLFLDALPLFADDTEGGETPQAVFDAAKQAGSVKDFNSFIKLVAPSERPMLAFGTDMGVDMFVEFYEGEKAEEYKKKYQDIQKKFGIKEEQEDEGETLQITSETPQEVIDAHMVKRAKKLYGHVDAVNYISELLSFMFSMPEMAEQPFFPYNELSNLNIDGDKATGTAGDKAVSFIKENNRWFLTAGVMD